MNEMKQKIEQLSREVEELRRKNSEFQTAETGFKQAITALLDSQKTLRALLNSPSDGIVLIDEVGKILEANEGMAQRLKKGPEELIGSSIWDLLPSGIGEQRKRYVEKVFQTGKPHRFEDRRGGLWLDNVLFPVFDRQGKVARTAVVARDITQGKEAEKALRESEEKYRQLFNVENDAIFLVDVETGRFLDANPAALRLYGYPLEELLRMHHREVSAEPEKSQEAVAAGETQVFHRLHRKKDGMVFPVEINGSYYDLGGRLVHVAAIRDITERKQNEEAMQEALLQYYEEVRKSQKLSQENMIIARIGRIIGATLNIEEVYESFVQEVQKLIPCEGLAVNIINHREGKVSVPFVFGPEMGGCQKGEVFPLAGSLTGEVMGSRSAMICSFDDPEDIQKKFPVLFKGYEQGLRTVIVVPLIAKDTVIGAMHFRSMTRDLYSVRELDLAERVGQQIAGAIANAQLFEERRLAEEELQRTQGELVATLKAIPDILFELDRQSRILGYQASEDAFLYTKPEMFLGKHVAEVMPPETAEIILRAMEEAIQKGRHLGGTYSLSLPEGIKWYELSIAAKGDHRDPETRFVVLTRDITDRKQLEEERTVMSKLESTGILAGGIAHDFNNLLGVILGNLDLIEMVEENYEKKRNFLIASRKAALEARSLTRQLITLAQGGEPVTQVIALSELLHEQIPLVLRGSRVSAEFAVQKDLGLTKADEGQIAQVVRNLALNGLQAMPEGGTLFVAAENVVVESPMALIQKPGNYVKVSITDQGEGIPPAIFPRIFDPYFSTKQRGVQKGMGLGLTICRSIIQRHGGAITIQTKEGRGTTVHFYLPRGQEAAKESPAGSINISGKGRVLVMDDEEMMLQMMGAILHRLGYEAEMVKKGEEVLDRYRTEKASGHPFDLVILDLTIRKGKGGKEAMALLQEIDPKVRAVVTSGYSQDPVVQNYKQFGFQAALLKPFMINELEEALNAAFEG
jgi:PAS domain S-box-containing protein